MSTVGIIGFGSFGKFLAEKLDEHCKVLVYSASNKLNQWASSLEEVTGSDYLILSIPLNAYDEVLKQAKPMLGKQTVVIDVCSVKQKPVEIIRTHLPDQPLVATHPLFGPESAANSLKDHVMVLCPDASDGPALKEVQNFSESLGLKVVVMGSEEHDKEMAVVQGLTFFIARTLDKFGLHEQKLSTPSFQKLLSLAHLEEHHSEGLFQTIQSGNKHAKAVRKQFIELAEELDNSIE